ncbi:MAG: ATP synthase subunit I [Acidobacteriia bacterium]|nr:ATP synthase subunit I [Terriglobia bacterium]
MNLFFAFLAGVSIGIFFYGGLWLTVRALVTTRHPILLTFSSFWGRTLIALSGFLYVMNGAWQNALACLAGFALGRVIVSSFLPKAGGSTRCT